MRKRKYFNRKGRLFVDRRKKNGTERETLKYLSSRTPFSVVILDSLFSILVLETLGPKRSISGTELIINLCGNHYSLNGTIPKTNNIVQCKIDALFTVLL